MNIVACTSVQFEFYQKNLHYCFFRRLPTKVGRLYVGGLTEPFAKMKVNIRSFSSIEYS